jgi:hypothetical protein
MRENPDSSSRRFLSVKLPGRDKPCPGRTNPRTCHPAGICHPELAICHPELAICHPELAICHPELAICHPELAICHPERSEGSRLSGDKPHAATINA